MIRLNTVEERIPILNLNNLNRPEFQCFNYLWAMELGQKFKGYKHSIHMPVLEVCSVLTFHIVNCFGRPQNRKTFLRNIPLDLIFASVWKSALSRDKPRL